MPEPVRLLTEAEAAERLSICEKCGQALPVVRRVDPPLPPLDHPNVVTIHDLPAGTDAKVLGPQYDKDGRCIASSRLDL